MQTSVALRTMSWHGLLIEKPARVPYRRGGAGFRTASNTRRAPNTPLDHTGGIGPRPREQESRLRRKRGCTTGVRSWPRGVVLKVSGRPNLPNLQISLPVPHFAEPVPSQDTDWPPRQSPVTCVLILLTTLIQRTCRPLHARSCVESSAPGILVVPWKVFWGFCRFDGHRSPFSNDVYETFQINERVRSEGCTSWLLQVLQVG